MEILKIHTEYILPPLPSRIFDWRATFDGYEKGGDMGYGRTETEAIQDLLHTASDRVFEKLDEALKQIPHGTKHEIIISLAVIFRD